MNTTNGDFIEKTIPNTKNATLNINIGGVDSTMTVEKFANAIVIPPVLPSSTLQLDFDINSTLQPIRDVTGNFSQLEISDDVIKVGSTLLIGSPLYNTGTLTIQGNLAGQEFYDRLWDGVEDPTIYTFYSNNRDFYLNKQDSIVDEAIMSFNRDSGYGKFINGTLYASKTTAEINDIASPVESLTFWNSDLKTLCFYDGTSWKNAVPYKTYVALISQSGTAAPVATVLENTLGGAVVWSRSVTGQYVGTLTSAFTPGKTACFVTSKTANDYVSQYDYFLESSNTNDINLTSVSITGAEDGLLLDKIIEVRVYN
jgi:hypothetical protein